jgi:hypothetical protein
MSDVVSYLWTWEERSRFGSAWASDGSWRGSWGSRRQRLDTFGGRVSY